MHFCLRIDAVQPQKSQSDAARLKTASQKEHTSLKARKARDFKGKGVLLRAFALACLIFYVACSTTTCAQRSNKDQRPRPRPRPRRRSRRRSRRKSKKDLRNTTCVFQHANCRDPPWLYTQWIPHIDTLITILYMPPSNITLLATSFKISCIGRCIRAWSFF